MFCFAVCGKVLPTAGFAIAYGNRSIQFFVKTKFLDPYKAQASDRFTPLFVICP